jgi:hypothetical protein
LVTPNAGRDLFCRHGAVQGRRVSANRLRLIQGLKNGVAGYGAVVLRNDNDPKLWLSLKYEDVSQRAEGDALETRYRLSVHTGRALAVHLVGYLKGKLEELGQEKQPFLFWLRQLLEHFKRNGCPALSSLLTLKSLFGDNVRWAGMAQPADGKPRWSGIDDQAGGNAAREAFCKVRFYALESHFQVT